MKLCTPDKRYMKRCVKKTAWVICIPGCLTIWGLLASGCTPPESPRERPNILMVISDDQSWPHTGAYGTDWVATPHFDTLAREGVLFNNAFVSAPSCAPSRASILAGRHFYQMKEGGVHGGFLPAEFPLYTHLLEDAGYRVGYTGKSCGPFWNHAGLGQQRDPYGKEFNRHRIAPGQTRIHSWNNIDYLANFREFLDQEPNRPFHFTFSSWEPHRPYKEGAAAAHGKDPSRLTVPPFMPDTPEVRDDLNEYAFEINRLDHDLGRFIETLKAHGLYDNTIIVVTSDNGMPFPHAKMHCYEYGTHVPFVISWPGVIQPSVPELASFFLEAAGCEVPSSMMPATLPNLLNLKKFTRHPVNEFVVWGKEKHNPAREQNLGYPIRAIRTAEYLLVKNYEPERWPAGPPPHYKDFMWRDTARATAHILKNQNDPAIRPFFERYTRKRPALELFDIQSDPACLHNLADQEGYREIVTRLEAKLEARLLADNDPRARGNGEFFESTPSQFSNPIDPQSGKPIFKTFPPPREPVPGMRTFEH